MLKIGIKRSDSTTKSSTGEIITKSTIILTFQGSRDDIDTINQYFSLARKIPSTWLDMIRVALAKNILPKESKQVLPQSVNK